MSKKRVFQNGIVYSTHEIPISDEKHEEATLPPNQQILKVTLDKKQRAGKIVTLIEGFIGLEKDAALLAKELKVKCGTGGTCNGTSILLQGDYKMKVIDLLKSKNYSVR